MHSHDHAAMARTRADFTTGGVLRSVPCRSFIRKLRFLSSTCPGDQPFHNEYRPSEVRDMLESSGLPVGGIWFSALHFNVLFVATRPD